MAERRTSAAKDLLTPREEAVLESYGVARNHFEHARDPLISKQHIDLEREAAAREAREQRGSIFTREDALLPEYNDRATSNDTGRDDQQGGSQMVKNDRPKLDNRPPEDMARPSDRETFDRKWFEESTRAREQNNDRDQDNDREYGR